MVNRNKWERLNSRFKSSVSHSEPRYVRLVNTIPKFFGTRCHYAKCDWLLHLPGQVIFKLARKLLVFSRENSPGKQRASITRRIQDELFSLYFRTFSTLSSQNCPNENITVFISPVGFLLRCRWLLLYKFCPLWDLYIQFSTPPLHNTNTLKTSKTYRSFKKSAKVYVQNQTTLQS